MAISSKRDFLSFFTQKCWGIFSYFKSTVLLTGSSQMTCTPVDHPLYFLCVHETAPESESEKQRERSVFFLWAICILHMQKQSMYFTIYTHSTTVTLMSIYLNTTFFFPSMKKLQTLPRWFVTFSSLQLTSHFMTLLSSEDRIIPFFFFILLCHLTCDLILSNWTNCV